jgi:hypothetical protein
MVRIAGWRKPISMSGAGKAVGVNTTLTALFLFHRQKAPLLAGW